MIALWSLRILDEMLKENQVDWEADIPLNMGQWLSIPMIILGLIIFLRLIRQKNQHNTFVKSNVSYSTVDGVIFEKFIGSIKNLKSKNFDDLFKIYQQILLITSGDFNKTISVLTELDRKYNITSDKYGIGNFVDDLKEEGYITENDSNQEIKNHFF